MFMPRDISYVDVAGILKRADLIPRELTRAEATRVAETPGIGWATFSKLFGGCRRSEWPQCSRVPGYSDFLCADVIAQPFAPHAAGKPGLLLRPPTVIETPETEKYTIHVLSNTPQGVALDYRGKYTRVPVPQAEIHFRWNALPHDVRILKLYYSSERVVTQYSVRLGGSNVLVLYRNPPYVPSVHESNSETNTGVSPLLWRSGLIYNVSMIKLHPRKLLLLFGPAKRCVQEISLHNGVTDKILRKWSLKDCVVRGTIPTLQQSSRGQRKRMMIEVYSIISGTQFDKNT
jgi:hypothetical protein